MASAAGVAGFRASLDLGSESCKCVQCGGARFRADHGQSVSYAFGSVPTNGPGCDRPRLPSGSCFLPRQMEAVPMAKGKTSRKRTPKHVLKLPDLEQSKSAVLNSLTSRSSQRTYESCNQRIHRVVLLGTQARFQQDCGHSVSDISRTAALCINHNQPAFGCRPDRCIKGIRFAGRADS